MGNCLSSERHPHPGRCRPPDETQLAKERESLLWGFVNTLHAQVQRLDRSIGKIAPEMKGLQREQGGSEIKSCELEHLTGRVQNLGDR